METFRSILQTIIFLVVVAIWLWGCNENIGTIAIGVPVLVIAYAAATSGDSKGGPGEPRIGGPFDGDG